MAGELSAAVAPTSELHGLQLALLQPEAPQALLHRVAAIFQRSWYEAVVLERAAQRECGWPACGEALPCVTTKLRLKAQLTGDDPETYCSRACQETSISFAATLPLDRPVPDPAQPTVPHSGPSSAAKTPKKHIRPRVRKKGPLSPDKASTGQDLAAAPPAGAGAKQLEAESRIESSRPTTAHADAQLAATIQRLSKTAPHVSEQLSRSLGALRASPEAPSTTLPGADTPPVAPVSRADPPATRPPPRPKRVSFKGVPAGDTKDTEGGGGPSQGRGKPSKFKARRQEREGGGEEAAKAPPPPGPGLSKGPLKDFIVERPVNPTAAPLAPTPEPKAALSVDGYTPSKASAPVPSPSPPSAPPAAPHALPSSGSLLCPPCDATPPGSFVRDLEFHVLGGGDSLAADAMAGLGVGAPPALSAQEDAEDDAIIASLGLEGLEVDGGPDEDGQGAGDAGLTPFLRAMDLALGWKTTSAAQLLHRLDRSFVVPPVPDRRVALATAPPPSAPLRPEHVARKESLKTMLQREARGLLEAAGSPQDGELRCLVEVSECNAAELVDALWTADSLPQLGAQLWRGLMLALLVAAGPRQHDRLADPNGAPDLMLLSTVTAAARDHPVAFLGMSLAEFSELCHALHEPANIHDQEEEKA
uniref:RTR1-type domain-containing protein n=1 Tax=Rhizochromulina marina TaxID=1034831 RepID=A0A7S2WTI4_9STRA